MLGAVAGFALVGTASFGSLRARARVEATVAAWPLGGFAATVIYLTALAAQLALAGG